MHLFKKLKYMDKSHSRFFAIMIFLAGFCLFTGVTYSFFALSKYLNSATLSIAKLKYELSSDNERFENSSIVVSAQEKLELNLNIKSLNNALTKYALNYQTDSDLVKIFYKDELEQNVSGTIGSLNSVLNAKIIIINESTENVNISFSIEGGYLQNELVSNINTKYVEESTKTLEVLNLSYSDEVPIFSQISPPLTGTNDTGIYKAQDNYGTSYYYRGNVSNNYVKFGDFYWRIIRINGDGSIRIIYDGTSAHTNGESNIDRLALTDVEWNTTHINDVKYVGYMYGGANGSPSVSKEQAQTNETNTNMKIQLENWYKINIKDKNLDKYLQDSIFCNDRSIPGKSETGWSYDTGLGFGSNYTAYGATARSNIWNTDVNKAQPKFTCENKNDAFTKEDTERGNGKLEEKIGLITADEIVAAGSGKYATPNENYYLYKGPTWYWAITPCLYYTNNHTGVFVVGSAGNLENYDTFYGGGVAPVISLTSEYVSMMIGDGTINNPYKIRD